MDTNRQKRSKFLETITLFLLGILFFAFPLVFTSQTTDLFGLPKQALLGFVALLTLFMWGLRMVNDGQVKIRRTPFDLPIILFTICLFLSAYFSVDKSAGIFSFSADSLTAFFPLFFAVIVYFVVVNTVKTEKNVLFLIAALLLGGVLSGVMALLSFFQVYLLPIQYSHVRTFTPFGSLLDQALYLAFLLPLTGYLLYATSGAIIRKQRRDTGNLIKVQAAGFFLATVFITAGFVITILAMGSAPGAKPLILPFTTGFQTAFAAISQDTARIAQSFLFGSGFGTYLMDFTRFKAASYNTNPDLWSFTFFRSSSFVLELLATVGILGLLSYFFLIYKVIKDRPSKKEGGYGVFLAIVLTIIASFTLPFSFIPLTLLFFLLAIFATIQGLAHPNKVYDLAVGLRIKQLGEKSGSESSDPSVIIAIILFLIFTASTVALGKVGIDYLRSDITFQQSLVAAQQNNGLLTYQLENQAINEFGKRDAYYRIFSQTNLALANSLALQQPKGQKISPQTQQTIYTLVQQSINSGRSAAAISPANTLNWQNLSSIYRSLIGFGQNADEFALAANQQAIVLDPNNPQEYINYGGIYYQLGQWDNAANQFAVAINLKPDYANAHYNLGHAFEAKGDLTDAIQQYQLVKQLVANDPVNSKIIDGEIKTLQTKIGEQKIKAPVAQENVSKNQPALGVNNPPAKLPKRNPKAIIPGPGISPEISRTPTVSTTPTPSGDTTPTDSPTPSQ